MKFSTNQSGSAHVVFLAIITIAILGGLAYFSYSRISNNAEQSDSSSPTAKTLESKSDVSQAKSDLDKVSSDEDLDPSQLDSDLNQL